MSSKNPCFDFEDIVRLAYRSLIKGINPKYEDKLIYIINYLMDNYWKNDISKLLTEGTIIEF